MSPKPALFTVRLTSRPLDLRQALRLVGCPEIGAKGARARSDTGAVVGFTGVIRGLEQGRPLRAIHYEEYRSMALREMRGILEEARGRWSLQAAALLHRVGVTPAGHPSVAVAVAAGHRGPAFEAARFLIDALKERVPLWKDFIFADSEDLPYVPQSTDKTIAMRRFLLAVPLLTSPKSVAAYVRHVHRGGGNAVELRADVLTDRGGFGPEDLRTLAGAIHRFDPRLMILLTPRDKREGGTGHLSQVVRQQIIETCLPEVDAVDVELRSQGLLQSAAPKIRDAGKLLVVSYHDFRKMPSASVLDRLLRDAAAYPDALLKIAVATPRRADVLRLLKWTRRHAPERLLAVMTMGESAAAGRLALAAAGSRLAFAALEESSAPGQVSLATFSRALRSLRRALRSAPRLSDARLLALAEETIADSARPDPGN